jgi:hypothetical protein
MARRASLLWLLAAIVLIVLLAYGFYPVASAVEGVGTIEPLFEDLVLVTSDFSGIVTRMRVGLRQDVDRGAPLFEYLSEGPWAVQSRGGMTRPSGSPPKPAPLLPEWYVEGNRRHVARADAMRHWMKRVSSSSRPLAWERLLQQRLNAKVDREDQVAMEEAQAAENVRLGRADSNLVQVFDRESACIEPPKTASRSRAPWGAWSIRAGSRGAFSSGRPRWARS